VEPGRFWEEFGQPDGFANAQDHLRFEAPFIDLVDQLASPAAGREDIGGFPIFPNRDELLFSVLPGRHHGSDRAVFCAESQAGGNIYRRPVAVSHPQNRVPDEEKG
jgi:hypothetical protein